VDAWPRGELRAGLEHQDPQRRVALVHRPRERGPDGTAAHDEHIDRGIDLRRQGP
jgi:hypothetical protein